MSHLTTDLNKSKNFAQPLKKGNISDINDFINNVSLLNF